MKVTKMISRKMAGGILLGFLAVAGIVTGGLSVAVYELYRWCNEPSGFLETDQVLWEEGGDRIGDHTAYAAPFVCGTSDQQWSRFKVGAGDVRTF